MNILCCPVNLWEAARESLRHAPGAKIIRIPREDISHPWEIYKSFWGKDDLVIIEQDIIIHEEVIPQFRECPEPWCLFPFRHYSAAGWMTTGIGCNRFRREFAEKVTPEAVEAIPGSCHRCQGRVPGCWAHLDGKTREAGEAAGFRIHVHWPSVGHRDSKPGEYPGLPGRGRLSWITATQTEALAVANANGVQLTNSSAAAVVSPLEGTAYTPANFFLPSYGASKALYVKAFGVLGTTSTPNITLQLYADSTQGSAGTSIATTGVTAGPASGSNMPWELDLLVSCVTTGGSGTFLADGLWKIYPTATTVQAMRISSSSANPNTAATLSTQVAYYWELWATFSAASSSNNLQVYGWTVLGLN
jgi:hypothetical protein